MLLFFQLLEQVCDFFLRFLKNPSCPMKIIVKIPMCRKSPALSCPCLGDILNHKERTPSKVFYILKILADLVK